MVGSKWMKAKMALGLNMCLYVPKKQDGSSSSSTFNHGSENGGVSDRLTRPSTPGSLSSGLKFLRSSSKSSSKTICAICLKAMKAGKGQAIFTAECSHSFHFHCITSSVKHGHQVCPICRTKWKEIPFQNTSLGTRKPRLDGALDYAMMNVPRNLSSPRPDRGRQVAPIFPSLEPALFYDDEPLDHQRNISTEESLVADTATGTLMIKTYPEISEVSKLVSSSDFSVLIHLKAPAAKSLSETAQGSARTPVDLVTVLDVSGSMCGTKLALLKRAMGFVIHNLGPFDRLSILAFSSVARGVLPLHRMNEAGKQEALQAVNSLVADGGTNIAEGLRKGAKVIEKRKYKNPVASIILLSDGKDTYTLSNLRGTRPATTDYKSLLPTSIQENNGEGFQIPIHTFGFGSDHDASLMHSISEISGGTFSFIEAESVIQDAFAQCIGGLLSVVVQELRLEVQCVHSGVEISSLKAGCYHTDTSIDKRTGFIRVGDLYADEERNFLVNVNIPVDHSSSEEMPLLKVKCVYREAMNKETVLSEESDVVNILRPKEMSGRHPVVSTEVNRQKIRLRVAEAISEARVLAERGDLAEAVSVLETCRNLLETASGNSESDQLYFVGLCRELKEMQGRMVNLQLYETTGRAYILSELSSHSWQRATARGVNVATDDSTTTMTYQTQSMVDMVNLSQTMVFGSPNPNPNLNRSQDPQGQRKQLQQAHSFPTRPKPR